MFVFCQANLGSAIPPAERHLGEMDETSYSPLIVGESYVVYALIFILDRVDFLLQPVGQAPLWAPSSLFNLVDGRVSESWELLMTKSHPDYKSLFEAFKISHIMGYPLLVNDYKHYVGIVEQDAVEVLRFMEEN